MDATHFDHVVVGSGINSLVCAAMLARAGRSVCLVERNDRLGGAIRTDETTLPGFRHDLMACWYPLLVTSPAFAELKDALAAEGLAFCNTDRPTGVILPDGRALVMHTDRARNRAAFDAVLPGEGDRYAADMAALEADLGLTFAMLGGDLWSRATLTLLAKAAWRRSARGLAGFFGAAMHPCRHWLTTTYRSDLVHALFAPWVLHTGLGPDSLLSGQMGRVIAFTLEAAGMPVVKGGGVVLVDAFAALLARHGTVVRTGTEAARVVVEKGRAIGIETRAGERIEARRGVVCNVPPGRLYGAMLAPADVPAPVRAAAAGYRFGRAAMQIHLALDAPARWSDPALDDVAMIHVTPGLNGVALAVAEAENGLLPRVATIVVGQPAILDPSRVPPGKGMLWIQLQELPRAILGDAAGLIEAPADGVWDDATAHAYADRIVERLCEHIPGLRASILARHVIAPPDLEALNSNLVGGDPYCGDCNLDQFAIWRPFAQARNHATVVPGLHHIGASTHPGPGLGAGSGYLAARALL